MFIRALDKDVLKKQPVFFLNTELIYLVICLAKKKKYNQIFYHVVFIIQPSFNTFVADRDGN